MPRGESRLTRIAQERRERVLQLISIRPMFVHELAKIMNVSMGSIHAYLNAFLDAGQVKFKLEPYGRGFKRKWSKV